MAAGGGSVINFGSSAGTEGEIGFAAYGAAKEAIRGLSKTAALEWATLGIRVNINDRRRDRPVQARARRSPGR